MHVSLKLLSCAAVAAMAASVAQAEPDKGFYKGRTVNYIVATSPGGVYDTNGRLVAEFMQKYLPGSTFVVQNMPGAGHLIGANFIYGSKPDGLTFGTFNTGLIYGQLGQDPNIKFDLTKMSWVGKVASDPRIILVTKDSGIKSFEDLKNLKQPVKFATAGTGSASMIEATMFVKALKLPIQIVSGYNGNEDQLAMRRGEVQGVIGSRSEFQPFVDEGQGKFIAQVGGSEKDVPQLSTMIDGEHAGRIVALVAAQSNISRLSAGPPGIPQARLEALQLAYREATADPEFLKKAAALALPVTPQIGEEVASSVKEALSQPDDIRTFVKETVKRD